MTTSKTIGYGPRIDAAFDAWIEWGEAIMIGVELYDHLIVTADGYTSLRERGLV